jgi:hypothetical protein
MKQLLAINTISATAALWPASPQQSWISRQYSNKVVVSLPKDSSCVHSPLALNKQLKKAPFISSGGTTRAVRFTQCLEKSTRSTQ